jgi:hypothetical protein
MIDRLAIRSLLLCAVLLACKPPVRVTPANPEASAEEIAGTGASVMLAAGDIASCTSDGDEATAVLVDSILRADSVAGVNDVVVTMGDNAYPDGSASNFAICFAESWGDSTKRILAKIRPSVGNHEHRSLRAAPYYQYFGDKAGDPTKGYYSFDHGEWRVLALNSEIIVNPSFSSAERLAQETWLRAELEANKKPCMLAYFHHPLFSSGHHGNDNRLRPIWDILAAGGVSVVLVGHDHHYERFQPSTSTGAVDSVNGMVSFLVGTGGGELRGMRRVISNSASRVEGYFGVLKLSLGSGEWRSVFLDTSGRIWDPSGGRCRGAPVAPDSAASRPDSARPPSGTRPPPDTSAARPDSTRPPAGTRPPPDTTAARTGSGTGAGTATGT